MQWKIARFERDTRYYTLLLEQDLWENWLVTRINGRRGTLLGQIRKEVYAGYKEASARFEALCSFRQKRRKYNKVEYSVALCVRREF